MIYAEAESRCCAADLSDAQLYLLKNYLYASTWREKHVAYRGARHANIPDLLGRMSFELAVTAGSSSAQEAMLGETEEWISWLDENPAATVHRRIIDTMFCANYPLMRAIYIDNEHPDLEQISTAQSMLSRVLNDSFTANYLAAQDEEPTSSYGFGAEALTLIGLQKYCVESIGTADYTAAPSLLSQDHLGNSHPYIKGKWDVSLFTSDMETPAYPIQVKASLPKKSDKKIASTAQSPVMLYLTDATKLPDEEVKPTIKELVADFCNQENSTLSAEEKAQLQERFTERIDLLLTALDQPSEKR